MKLEFRRYQKFLKEGENKIIREEISLPEVPIEVLKRYPKILEGIES